MTLEEKILTGLTDSHIVSFEGSMVHKEAVSALTALANELKQNGFELGMASSFRSFESQLNIWNKKARGEKVLLDADSKVLDYSKLSPTEIVHAILRWSALPGLSRHHWGTDFDVFDKKTMPENYQIQLVPSEFEKGGYFSKMHAWLDKNMSRFGFFRPYQKDLGGVSPERWHISYLPLSEKLFKAHSVELESRALSSCEMELGEEVLAELDSLFARYFLKVSAK